MAPTFMTHVIIPAAGFGKRVGGSTSKELLYYKEDSFPLIQWCLRLCKKYEMKPIVISREDKHDLNKYLRDQNIDICLIAESEEWTHSVELSQNSWGDKNILVLPDSRFEPQDILVSIQKELEQNKLIFGTFKVANPDVWGILAKKDNSYWVAEKPKNIDSFESYEAWGVIGFQAYAGKKLFSDLRKSSKDHAFYQIEFKNMKHLSLSSYDDVTRSRENLYLAPKS